MKHIELESLVEKQHILPSLSLEITNRCNLKCVHCFVEDRSTVVNQQYLSLDKVKSILKQAHEMNVFKISLTGGEPFSHPQINEILKEIKRYKFICYVLSNGTLINEKNIHTIKKCVNKLFLSNYGFTKECYEDVTRTPGAYSAYHKSLELLKAFDVPYEERIILLSENEKEVSQYVESDLKIETCICGDRFDNYAAKHRPSDESVEKVYYKLISKDMCKKRNADDYVCNVGCTSITVKSNGDITPCNNYGMIIGNINTDTIVSVWNGELLNCIKEHARYKYFKKCYSCPDRAYSLFILPCNNYQENGDSNIPSSETCRHCKIIKNVIQTKSNINK